MSLKVFNSSPEIAGSQARQQRILNDKNIICVTKFAETEESTFRHLYSYFTISNWLDAPVTLGIGC